MVGLLAGVIASVDTELLTVVIAVLLGVGIPVGLALVLLKVRDRWRESPVGLPAVCDSPGHPPSEAPSVTPQAWQGRPVGVGPTEPPGSQTFMGCLMLLGLLGFSGCFVYRNFIYDGPVPQVVDVALRDRPGFDFAYVVNVKVVNNGRAGKVRVTADLKYGNFWTKYKVIDMAAGETQVVQIVFTEPTFLEGGLQGECEARAKPEWYFESQQGK